MALSAFLHENRIAFPVAIDRSLDGNPVPATMSAYAMQGTPTFVLIDRQGYIRTSSFGVVEDMALGADIVACLGTVSDRTD